MCMYMYMDEDCKKYLHVHVYKGRKQQCLSGINAGMICQGVHKHSLNLLQHQ